MTDRYAIGMTLILSTHEYTNLSRIAHALDITTAQLFEAFVADITESPRGTNANSLARQWLKQVTWTDRRPGWAVE
jgi:hypothetical protein